MNELFGSDHLPKPMMMPMMKLAVVISHDANDENEALNEK